MSGAIGLLLVAALLPGTAWAEPDEESQANKEAPAAEARSQCQPDREVPDPNDKAIAATSDPIADVTPRSIYEGATSDKPAGEPAASGDDDRADRDQPPVPEPDSELPETGGPPLLIGVLGLVGLLGGIAALGWARQRTVLRGDRLRQ